MSGVTLKTLQTLQQPMNEHRFHHAMNAATETVVLGAMGAYLGLRTSFNAVHETYKFLVERTEVNPHALRFYAIILAGPLVTASAELIDSSLEPNYFTTCLKISSACASLMFGAVEGAVTRHVDLEDMGQTEGDIPTYISIGSGLIAGSIMTGILSTGGFPLFWSLYPGIISAYQTSRIIVPVAEAERIIGAE